MISGNLEFDIPPNTIWAVIILLIAFHFRRLARDNRGAWIIATRRGPRSFDYTDPAMEIARRGCVGIFLWAFYELISLTLIVFTLDLFFTSGQLILVRLLRLLLTMLG